MPVSTAQQLCDKRNLYFQICLLPLSDCAIKKPLQQSSVLSESFAILLILHSFAYATSQRARLPTQSDIRQPAGKIANHSLQSVCVCVFDMIHLNVLLTLFLSQLVNRL